MLTDWPPPPAAGLNDGVEERRLESPTVALLDRTSPRSSSNFNPSRMGELLKPNCSLQCRFGRQDRTLAELATGDRVGKLLDNGFTEREVQGMVRENPAQVLGARTAAATAGAH